MADSGGVGSGGGFNPSQWYQSELPSLNPVNSLTPEEKTQGLVAYGQILRNAYVASETTYQTTTVTNTTVSGGSSSNTDYSQEISSITNSLDALQSTSVSTNQLSETQATLNNLAQKIGFPTLDLSSGSSQVQQGLHQAASSLLGIVILHTKDDPTSGTSNFKEQLTLLQENLDQGFISPNSALSQLVENTKNLFSQNYYWEGQQPSTTFSDMTIPSQWDVS